MTTFATLKRRPWEVNLEKHERAVAVGAVHGDLRALLDEAAHRRRAKTTRTPRDDRNFSR